MDATPATGPTLGTRHPTPMRHIFTVTLGIAEALASTFTLHPQITAIGTADPDISIIGIAASIVVGKVAQSLPTQVAGAAHIAARQGSPQFAACFISNVAHAKNDCVGKPVIQIRYAARHDQGLVCHSTCQETKRPRQSLPCGAFLYPPVRFIAVPVSVDPLGSCAMGASVFPEIFLGSLAIRPVPTGFAKRRVAWLPICIPPRASANVLGRANAIASAIVVTFMAVSFSG